MNARFILIAAVAGLLAGARTPAVAQGDASGGGGQRVELRILGGERREPLAGVDVLLTDGYGDEQVKYGPFKTDDAGAVIVVLPPAFYYLHLSSDKEWPYLPVEVLWSGRTRGPMPGLNLRVTETGAEKWLDGEQRDDGYEPPARPGDAPRITYTLLAACELLLRAVDAKLGKGLPGAEFYEENALGEDWAHPIDGENLGWREVPDDAPGASVVNRTDADGNFKRLVGASANFAYGAWRPPAGYEAAEPGHEFDLNIAFGQERAEKVFRFRHVDEKK